MVDPGQFHSDAPVAAGLRAWSASPGLDPYSDFSVASLQTAGDRDEQLNSNTRRYVGGSYWLGTSDAKMFAEKAEHG
jgi:hypothetical protein